MPNIQPIEINLNNPNPLFTVFYRDVLPPNRFDNLNDPILEPYYNFLNKFYRNHEIVGNTEADFFVNLEISWHFKRANFYKYLAILEKVKPKWGREDKTISNSTSAGVD